MFLAFFVYDKNSYGESCL